MVDANYGIEQGRTVAVLTYICRLDVRTVLASRRGPVMAGRTITGHGTVVKQRWRPGTRTMTIVTGCAAGNMIRCLASRCCAVMAAETGAGCNTAMIEGRG